MKVIRTTLVEYGIMYSYNKKVKYVTTEFFKKRWAYNGFLEKKNLGSMSNDSVKKSCFFRRHSNKST